MCRLHHLGAVLAALTLPWAASAQEVSPERLAKGKEAFETNCRVCHDLSVPKSHHYDRANWEWVVDDMVNNYGATFITEEQQKLVVDYLAATQSPKQGGARGAGQSGG